jgi:hypothetical protein
MGAGPLDDQTVIGAEQGRALPSGAIRTVVPAGWSLVVVRTVTVVKPFRRITDATFSSGFPM